MPTVPLTQKQRRLLLALYREADGSASRQAKVEFDDIPFIIGLEDKGMVIMQDDAQHVALTQAGYERARMLELNEQRRG